MSGISKQDIEQVVDYVLTLAQKRAASTKWRWDDVAVSILISGRDGFVRMVCRMLGVQIDASEPAAPALVAVPMRGEVTHASLGIDDPGMAGIPPRLLQLLQFILNLVAKWVGPVVPVPTPTE